MGGSSSDIGYGLSIAPTYNVYVTGEFRNTVDFNPGLDTANLISTGFSDIFIAKYSQCETPLIIRVSDSITINCEGDSVSFIVTATGGAVPLNFQWKKDGNDITGATDTIFSIPSVIADTSGSYICIVTNVCGTDTSKPMTLIANPAYNIPVSDSICLGDSIQLLGGLWVTSAGIYYDTLITVAACDSVITTVLTVNPCNGICSDGIQNQGETGVDCGGPCPACPEETCNDNIQNQDETSVDCGGICPPCTDIPDFNIPNVFTPNGDGANDKWIIRGATLYPEILVEVYNEWGTLLFSSKGYSVPWDGTYQGKALPTTAYYYIITLSDGENIFTGTVTIKR